MLNRECVRQIGTTLHSVSVQEHLLVPCDVAQCVRVGAAGEKNQSVLVEVIPVTTFIAHDEVTHVNVIVCSSDDGVSFSVCEGDEQSIKVGQLWEFSRGQNLVVSSILVYRPAFKPEFAISIL